MVFGSSRSVKTREADQNHYLLYFTSFLVSFSRLLSTNWVRSLAKVNALVFFGQLHSFWQNERSQRPNISHLSKMLQIHIKKVNEKPQNWQCGLGWFNHVLTGQKLWTSQYVQVLSFMAYRWGTMPILHVALAIMMLPLCVWAAWLSCIVQNWWVANYQHFSITLYETLYTPYLSCWVFLSFWGLMSHSAAIDIRAMSEHLNIAP